jgi:hypothetical protein
MPPRRGPFAAPPLPRTRTPRFNVNARMAVRAPPAPRALLPSTMTLDLQSGRELAKTQCQLISGTQLDWVPDISWTNGVPDEAHKAAALSHAARRLSVHVDHGHGAIVHTLRLAGGEPHCGN